VIILGLNAYHGDSSACIVVDGKLIAAAEEERFRRIKHWAGFPSEAIKFCLTYAGMKVSDVDHIAINRNPNANLLKKALFAIRNRPSLSTIRDRLSNAGKVRDIKSSLCDLFSVESSIIKAQIHNVEHHRAHLASSFFVSPFDSATVVSVDGFGDFVSTMWGEGNGGRIKVHGQVNFPHSLGLFYLAITQYLGFNRYGDEYKVMGLAPYGKPSYMDAMRRMVKLQQGGEFELDLDFFLHHCEGVSMSWNDGEPYIGTTYSKKLEELLGPARKPDQPLQDRHRDIAASVQEMYEEAFFHILNAAYQLTGNPVLCLSGGCAMNSVANGKIFERTPFSELYVQSAAGDGGGAIGAAFYVWNQELRQSRSYTMDHAYLGPEFSDDYIEKLLVSKKVELMTQNCIVTKVPDEQTLSDQTADHIASGKVVGWFQGRMEWGPRALGNRSIVCDPRRADIKDILNLKIKRRESFRPFAPSILRESVAEWFETDYDVPFMLQVYQIRSEKQKAIPAVTHVNGSGRLQTVTKEQNRRYYRLIKAFETLSGVPIVLNTSFNENEPVVCKPEEALECFLRTKMDVVIMGNWVVERKESSTES
jgi:carbamoyltransferase